MAKNIFKEIIIILLLCLAIILLLGILLYDYVPMTKTIPNAVSYTTPDDVEQELAEADSIDESQIIMTYEVDSTDLNNYKRIQDYKPGKANPFSSYETTQNNATTGNTTTAGSSGSSSGTSGSSSTGTSNDNQSTSSSQNNNNNNNNNSNDSTTTSGGKFFQDKGTK